MGNRYEYASAFEYELHAYEEKINFAKYKVESQLKSAILRKKEEEFELKLYGGIFLAMLILFPIDFVLTMAGGIFAILGGVTMIVLVFLFIFIMPVCIYKIIKGILLWSINRQNTLGKWLMERYAITNCGAEIYTCQFWIGKYRLLLEDIERWKEEKGKRRTITLFTGTDQGAVSSDRFRTANRDRIRKQERNEELYKKSCGFFCSAHIYYHVGGIEECIYGNK